MREKSPCAALNRTPSANGGAVPASDHLSIARRSAQADDHATKTLLFEAPLSFFLVGAVTNAAAQYLGNLSTNPYAPNSLSNPYGAGNPYNPDSPTNPYGRYGNPYSPNSTTNPYATHASKLYDENGNYRGRLSTNPYDPDSVSNPYGRYGNSYSPDSINNDYGAGNPYSPSSPTNPYGSGVGVYGDDD